MSPDPTVAGSANDDASQVFAERVHGTWTAEKEALLNTRLREDMAFATAYARVQDAWASLDAHSDSPEIMRHREIALASVRRASARRWSLTNPIAQRRGRIAAVGAGLIVVLGIVWQLSPYGYVPGEYHTGLGEQKTVELPDHSRIVIDAVTRLRVGYTADARVVELASGQAQFSVTHDPARPFKVLAGDRAVVAVGTVFTVEYVDRRVHVATLEGRVAVVDAPARVVPTQVLTTGRTSPASDSPALEVSAGEELRAAVGGSAAVIPQADLEAATAWRQGKIVFRTEPLGEAVRRINRYSRVQIVVNDPILAAKKISGVFETGDAQGFADAVEQYLGVRADSPDQNRIVLTVKPSN
jgi:transmembrane sensor